MIFYIRARTLLILIAACVLLLLQVLTHHSAHADALPPENLRTVTFYANHPAFMRKMLAACRDDPGHGRTRPDCINARGGELLEAEIEARRHLGYALTSPTTTTYWKLHATDLPSRLYYCSHVDAAAAALMFCSAAQQANQQIEQANTQLTQR